MKQTPNYIKNLLTPTVSKAQSRKIWSVDLETVWLPFFTATNVMGDTVIPLDALGHPLRLGHNKDGSVKFNKSGRPVTTIAKPISQAVTLVRENFVASLQDYSNKVATERENEWNELVKRAIDSGKPIQESENAEIKHAVELQVLEAMEQAEKNDSENAGNTDTESETESKKELIPA